jgi:GNAT superfamily N-acetyltransferase
MFTEGMKGLVVPAMKTVYPYYFRIACFLFVPVVAVAVKWSLWILVLYMIACIIMTASTYINIYLTTMDYITECLNSDLLDIEKYYQDESCMFVAECNGRVVGMVGVAKKEQHKPGVAELQRMSVCSSVLGKGTGTLLANKVVEFCKEKKYEKLVLTTTSCQYAAIALYKKCGFKHSKTENFPGYFLHNLYFVIFEKDI